MTEEELIRHMYLDGNKRAVIVKVDRGCPLPELASLGLPSDARLFETFHSDDYTGYKLFHDDFAVVQEGEPYPIIDAMYGEVTPDVIVTN